MPVAEVLPSATSLPPTATAFQPLSATATIPVYATFTPTIPVPTATPHPLEKYTITAMRARLYGNAAIQMVGQISDEGEFSREKFRYVSDGINIYGFVNIPKGTGPFPVVILLHGNYNTVNYKLMPYTTGYADDMARQGYVVFHPNMRNYGESGSGDDAYRTGQASDVLNLIAMIKAQGGQSGALSMLDPNKIALWGYSMGGEVALRVLTITNQVDAAVLYAPMSGDLLKAAKFIQSDFELNTPPDMLNRISAQASYELITVPIRLYHGTSDKTVPVGWSQETCTVLTNLGKNVECTFYEAAGHSFGGHQNVDFMKSFYAFFETYLK